MDIAWKKGIEILARNVGSAFVSRTISRFPLTRTPEAFDARPSRTACAPTMLLPDGSLTNWNAGDWRFRSRARLIAYA